MISLVNAHAYHIPLRPATVHCVVTSPPYWSLRDYGIPGQLGLEPLHDCMGWTRGENCNACFICNLRTWAAEVWRVLRDDGTFWLNLGDSYAGGKTGRYDSGGRGKFGGVDLGFRNINSVGLFFWII